MTLFKCLNTGDIAAGGSKEVKWTPDRDIIIHKLLLVERSDQSLSNVQLYIMIARVVYTIDYMPAAAIGTSLEYCWKPMLPVSKGAEIYLKFTNSTAATVNIDVVFEFEWK